MLHSSGMYSGIAFVLFVLCGLQKAVSQMDKQSICANKVRADIEATAKQSSSVLSTVRSYTFEYSRKYASCVIIMQYNVQDKVQGKIVQILAINAFTMQSMEAHKNIFLAKSEDTANTEQAAQFLFEKYSK